MVHHSSDICPSVFVSVCLWICRCVCVSVCTGLCVCLCLSVSVRVSVLPAHLLLVCPPVLRTNLELELVHRGGHLCSGGASAAAKRSCLSES